MKSASKFQLTAIGISLGVIGGLLSVNVSKNFQVNMPGVLAQEVSPNCPLPQDIAVTFLDSKCKEVKLEASQTFYRYYSGDNNKFGRYLTTESYTKNTDVIRKLALNQEWGNKATMKLEVTLPAGTVVYQGIVAPQNPAACYPGGGQQTFIKDTRASGITWTDKGNMIVEPFSCP